MNCKPDDLAILVQTHEETKPLLGRIYQLTGYCGCGPAGDPCFKFEGAPAKGRNGRNSWVWHCLPDAWLRPIRDPGDDAVDETLVRTPTLETV